MDEAFDILKHKMNVTSRRLARQILKTSYAPANQTLQLDLGWMTVKSELKMKRMQLGIKLLQPKKLGTIAQDTLNHALDIGTPWTDEVNEDISDLYGNGKWLRKYPKVKQLHLA